MSQRTSRVDRLPLRGDAPESDEALHEGVVAEILLEFAPRER